ncbi:ABC transporter ATP-binding protein [Streptococcus pneumoniae]|uniref:ABC transporter ATP-binding protein n=11 Tax=Streptococcus TaxID=1301 RepID=A0A4J1RGK6_STREE|nr:ABC transporter ATP-binding protein [Streptococcus pneumoniae]TVW36932.1 ABC transporter ATP-binding protein [Streptococcus pneumoniae]CZC82941.1 ABC transporter ATP-binding protein [Streptococcus pneumoniae]CZC90446.1 ABC transporter ATP-binding protein [Streptococcus pneumoniae]CZD58074.1 ABC transporter ATP-binding protein [Streptococcus pneumoniae]
MKLKLLRVDTKVIMGSFLLVLSSLLALLLPLILKGLIDGSSIENIGSKVFQSFLIFIGQALFSSIGYYLFSQSGEKKIAKIRKKVIEGLIYAEKSFFDKSQSGELTSAIVNDTSVIREFLITTFPNIILSLVMVLGSIVVLFSLDWNLSLLLFITLPCMMFIILPLSNISEKYSRRLQEEIGFLTGQLTEKIQEHELIKTNQAEKSVQDVLDNCIERVQNNSLKSDRVTSFETPFALLFIFATIAVMLTYGGYRVSAGYISVGTLVSFLIYLFQLLNPISNIANFVTVYSRSKGSSVALENLLAVPKEKFEGGKSVSGQGLNFNHVYFGYDENRPVLKDITCSIFKGQKIAFVGPSGSGKSTIVRLLEQFYKPLSGDILMEQSSIYDFNLKEWRSKIAWVSQNNAVLSGSIRDNLCLGLNRLVTDDELMKVLDLVSLGDEIRSMKEGLDTEVGERGRFLSGGQSQRLQIARTYLKDAEILIFDESTANLDAYSEYAIISILYSALKEKTVVIIAHRLSTVKDVDCIFFLEERKITGSGTHKELLENHERYARFVQEQMIE